MGTRLIVISNNLSYGEALAFSLHNIFGLEEHVVHRASANLFSRLRSIGLEGSFIIIEDGIPGLNYPSLIDRINSFSPAYQLLLSDGITRKINSQKLTSLGCGEIIKSDTEFKGIVNAILSWRLNESPLDFKKEPMERLSDENRQFLKDIYYLNISQIKEKYSFTQQRAWAKKVRLFDKLKLNPSDKQTAFRVLCHVYNL